MKISDEDIVHLTDRFKELVMKPNKDLFEKSVIAKIADLYVCVLGGNNE